MKQVRKLPTKSDISSEQLLLSPGKDGIDGIVAISHGHYSTNWQALPLHIHDAIELCLCSRGSLVFECEGETHTLLPNNVFLTQPGMRHHLITNHSGMRMYWLFYKYPAKDAAVLGLSRRETQALNGHLQEIGPRPFAVGPSVRQHFRDLFKTYENMSRGPYRTLVLRTLLLKILLEVVANSSNQSTLKALAGISRLAQTIREHPARHFTVAELAACAKLSESHFTALFRQVVGLPPHAYFTTCRLERARQLLTTTARSVADIASELHFASPQHLATQFRKTFGASPSTYRAGNAS